MATLNTLRTRGGIVVSIVIGIALLAFLPTLVIQIVKIIAGVWKK